MNRDNSRDRAIVVDFSDTTDFSDPVADLHIDMYLQWLVQQFYGDAVGALNP